MDLKITKYFTTVRIMNNIQFLELDNSSVDDLVFFQKKFRKDLNENISDRSVLKKSQIYSLIAYSRNSIVGFLIAQRIIDSFEINSFFISPSFRRMGVGENLLQTFIKNCSKKKITSIYLEVMRSNKVAMKLYSKFNFLSYGSRDDYYVINGLKYDAILMKLNLN